MVTLPGMRPTQRLFVHVLRMLVLAIALVVSPTRTVSWDYSAAETPVLVVALAKPEPPSAPSQGEARRVDESASSAAQFAWPRRQTAVPSDVANRQPIRVLDRYLLNCAWLC